jgi:hypothetical protein
MPERGMPLLLVYGARCTSLQQRDYASREEPRTMRCAREISLLRLLLLLLLPRTSYLFLFFLLSKTADKLYSGVDTRERATSAMLQGNLIDDR